MKIKYPISLKQILLFSFLIILVLGVSTSLVSTLIRADDRIKAEENNLALNSRTAQTVETAFENIKSNTYFLFEAFYAVNDSKQKAALAQSFFRSNQDVLFVSSEETGLLFNPSAEQFSQAVKDFLETPELKNVINSTSSQTNHKTAYLYPSDCKTQPSKPSKNSSTFLPLRVHLKL